ncbi:MAG: hypothetical protein V4436_00705 [Patescibacteria group bacterium]
MIRLLLTIAVLLGLSVAAVGSDYIAHHQVDGYSPGETFDHPRWL